MSVYEVRRQAEQEAVGKEYDQWDQFRVQCSCPPDTQIHINGGYMWQGVYGGDGVGWKVARASFDFANDSDTGTEITFSNADYYIGVVATLYLGAYPGEENRLSLHWDESEYATAVEAEEAAVAEIYDGSVAFEDFPLAIVILRNNGDTVQANQFLPIEPLNRGRSYFWQDVRPLLWL